MQLHASVVIVTDFAITFEIGYPALREAWQMTDQPANAIVQCYLTLLAKCA